MSDGENCDSLSSLGDSEVTETSNNNTTDLSGMSRLQEKEEMIKSQVTSPPTVSPTMSQQRKVRAPTTSGPGSTKSVTTSLPNISPTNKSLIGGEQSLAEPRRL